MSGGAVLDHLPSYQLPSISTEDRPSFSQKVAGILIVAGTSSLPNLRSSLLNISNFFHLKNKSVPLTGHIYGTGSKSIVVFDPSNFLSDKSVQSNLLAQNCVWSEHGLFSSFGGVTHSDVSRAKANGSLVWKMGNKTYVTQKASPWSSPEHPSSLVFLINQAGAPPVSKVDEVTDGLVSRGKSIYESEDAKASSIFGELARGAKVSVHVVNTHGSDLAKVSAVLDNIMKGTLDKASVTPNSILDGLEWC